ncbi:MAG: hypothetical protein IIB56_09245 [Planctomycetes bacterium]|nr:hypothetical protein [Planctomycetota bacterium]
MGAKKKPESKELDNLGFPYDETPYPHVYTHDETDFYLNGQFQWELSILSDAALDVIEAKDRHVFTVVLLTLDKRIMCEKYLTLSFYEQQWFKEGYDTNFVRERILCSDQKEY